MYMYICIYMHDYKSMYIYIYLYRYTYTHAHTNSTCEYIKLTQTHTQRGSVLCCPHNHTHCLTQSK